MARSEPRLQPAARRLADGTHAPDGPVQAVRPSMAAMHQHADEAVAVLKAMASHSRLLLLCQLVQGEGSVGEQAQALELAQSVVSQHLSLLRREGIVSGRRKAQSIHYRITDQRVHSMMDTMF